MASLRDRTVSSMYARCSRSPLHHSTPTLMLIAIDEGAERTWWPMAARDAELSSTVPMHQPPTMNWPPMATPCATAAPPAVPSAMPQRELRLLGSCADALHKNEEVTRRRWKLVMYAFSIAASPVRTCSASASHACTAAPAARGHFIWFFMSASAVS